jgi:hypothetical protein
MSEDKHTVVPAKPWWAEYTPETFAQTLPGIPYMMPSEFLPVKDCKKCQWHQEGWRDGGFCYMFRVEPEGEKCGQMNRVN